MNTESTVTSGLLHRTCRWFAWRLRRVLAGPRDRAAVRVRGGAVTPRTRNRSARVGTARSIRARHRVLSIAALLAVATLVVGGTGELVARHVIRDKVAGRVPALGSDVSVSESGGLALWDLVNGDIPELEVSSDDATFGRLSQVEVNAQLHDIHLGAVPTVSSTDAEISVSTQSIAAAIESAAPSLTVSSVATDPSAGTLTAAVGPGGIGRLTLKPALSDGKVTFDATSLTVMGEAVPLGGLGQTGTGAGVQQTYPLGLKATALSVTPDGVQVTLRGGPSTLGGDT